MIEIRQVTVEYSALILRFVIELAIYEKAENEVIATQTDIDNSICGSDPTNKADICSINNDSVDFVSSAILILFTHLGIVF